MTAIEQLHDFLIKAKDSRSMVSWLRSEELDVYVRKGLKCAGEIYTTLEIASISAYPQGIGTFTRFLDAAELEVAKSEHIDMLYIENVLTTDADGVRFSQFFEKRGYHRRNAPGDEGWAPCYYKTADELKVQFSHAMIGA